jgi:hypothetical protein
MRGPSEFHDVDASATSPETSAIRERSPLTVEIAAGWSQNPLDAPREVFIRPTPKTRPRILATRAGVDERRMARVQLSIPEIGCRVAVAVSSTPRAIEGVVSRTPDTSVGTRGRGTRGVEDSAAATRREAFRGTWKRPERL